MMKGGMCWAKVRMSSGEEEEVKAKRRDKKGIVFTSIF
jgi:hypothetical protein